LKWQQHLKIVEVISVAVPCPSKFSHPDLFLQLTGFLAMGAFWQERLTFSD
jgi:hypothetical protein